MLPNQLVFDLLEDFRVRGSEGCIERIRHGEILCLGRGRRGKSTRAWKGTKTSFGRGEREDAENRWLESSGLCGELFESVVDEGSEVPAVDVLVGSFSGRVVTAGEDAGDEVDTVLLEGSQDFL